MQFNEEVLEVLQSLNFVIDDDKCTARIPGRVTITGRQGNGVPKVWVIIHLPTKKSMAFAMSYRQLIRSCRSRWDPIHVHRGLKEHLTVP